MDANKLKSRIKEKGFSISTIAILIGVHNSLLHKKIHGSEPMTIYEAKCIKEILNLSNEEALDIFFSKE